MKWRKFLSVAGIAVLFCILAVSVQAKSFVYCSEGGPEGFTPALYISGTTFGATAKTVYDQLAMF